ncbi:MAG: 4Fe-4S dicluster domain-containing protein [Gemmatimonadota bacterium]
MRPNIRTEADRSPEFAHWITSLPGAEKIRECMHCGLCSASCPLFAYMDYSPRQLMYLGREGFRDDVLGSFTIWLCTSCYQCTVECPRQIPVTEIMYALKRRAIEEKTYPKRLAIPVLAREFRRMVYDRGRISESWLVMKLMLKTGIHRMFGMVGLGWNLLRTGRFSLRRETIRHRRDLARMLEAVGHDSEVVP